MKNWISYSEWYMINHLELCKQLMWIEKHSEECKKYQFFTMKEFMEALDKAFLEKTSKINK